MKRDNLIVCGVILIEFCDILLPRLQSNNDRDARRWRRWQSNREKEGDVKV